MKTYQQSKLQPSKDFMLNMQVKYGPTGTISKNFVRELTTMSTTGFHCILVAEGAVAFLLQNHTMFIDGTFKVIEVVLFA